MTLTDTMRASVIMEHRDKVSNALLCAEIALSSYIAIHDDIHIVAPDISGRIPASKVLTDVIQARQAIAPAFKGVGL